MFATKNVALSLSCPTERGCLKLQLYLLKQNLHISAHWENFWQKERGGWKSVSNRPGLSLGFSKLIQLTLHGFVFALCHLTKTQNTAWKFCQEILRAGMRNQHTYMFALWQGNKGVSTVPRPWSGVGLCGNKVKSYNAGCGPHCHCPLFYLYF